MAGSGTGAGEALPETVPERVTTMGPGPDASKHIAAKSCAVGWVCWQLTIVPPKTCGPPKENELIAMAPVFPLLKVAVVCGVPSGMI